MGFVMILQNQGGLILKGPRQRSLAGRALARWNDGRQEGKKIYVMLSFSARSTRNGVKISIISVRVSATTPWTTLPGMFNTSPA